MRFMYQGISFGRLPAHINRNCEKLKYAQSITKANSSVPRSRRCFEVITSESGGRDEISKTIAIKKETPEMPWPPRNRTPYMVENQAGSNGKTHSVDKTFTVPP